MGMEAEFQAIPEDWEWLIKARQNREIAEELQFFQQNATIRKKYPGYDEKSLSSQLTDAIQNLVEERPGLISRHFYAGARTFGIITYLLSPQRRMNQSDRSLIRKIFYGFEPLQPEANATQGIPIGFIPSADVVVVADYLSSITMSQLREHWIPAKMGNVYKFSPSEERFQVVWQEFVGMRDVYLQAQQHGEAVIISID